MPSRISGYRIFIASPAGLRDEREIFRDILKGYNESDALQEDALFIPVGWEDTLGGAGRPQAIINEEIRTCDCFILLLWDRWGSSPGSLSGHSSGTEEEFHVARECLKDKEKPLRQIIVLFKGVEARQLADPGPQLQKVCDFKSKLEAEKYFLFHTFDSLDEFERILRRHLARWRREHEGGDDKLPVGGLIKVHSIVPIDSLGVVVGSSAQIDAGAEKWVDEAESFAKDGKLSEAEAKFAQAVVNEPSPFSLNCYGNFLFRIGRGKMAEVMYAHALDLSQKSSSHEWITIARLNLSAVFRSRGELEKAESTAKAALGVETQANRTGGVAACYESLGTVHETRGELELAHDFLSKSLRMYHELSNDEAIARLHGKLGVVFQLRGQFKQAETEIFLALKAYERLNKPEGMATQWISLGFNHLKTGQVDDAEEVLNKALAIEQKLGRPVGIADAYGNLGLVNRARRDFREARIFIEMALQIFEQIGQQADIATCYSNLGLICSAEKRFTEAEEMQFNALALNEAIGRRPEIANALNNLGTIYQLRGEVDKAEEMHNRALEVCSQSGFREGIARACLNLASIAREKGRRKLAQDLGKKAYDEYSAIGLTEMVKKTGDWLSEF